MDTFGKQSATNAIFGIYRLLAITLFIIALYVAQSIIIPLALAALLTFLLSPLVTTLEKWLGRVLSILLVVIVVFSLLGFAGYVFAKQFAEFGANFEKYYTHIQAKILTIEFPQTGFFGRIGHAVKGLTETLGGTSIPEEGQNLTQAELKLIDLSSNFANFAKSFFGSVFYLLGVTGLVLLLVIFMLLHQEDIKSRIIRLAGQERIGATTTALDDASDRVFNYLVRLFIVNIGFGLAVAIGLRMIGLPNVVFWGFLAAILRFIPYIGPWIAAILPIGLSFFITDTWMVPVLTVLFFVVLELFTAYVIEPYYYGEGTGVSAFALILAAVFWTWLWGPIGLLLSTPLTVCLVVLGHYAANLEFLRVLFSKEEPLTVAEEAYHRLLSFDVNESMNVIERYLQKNNLESMYDEVLVPIIIKTEIDDRRDLITTGKKEELYNNLTEIIDFLNINQKDSEEPSTQNKTKILCVPVRGLRDELGVNILSNLLSRDNFEVDSTPRVGFKEILKLVDERQPNMICIVAVAPFDSSYTQFLVTKLKENKSRISVVVCLFGYSSTEDSFISKLNALGIPKVSISVTDAVNLLKEQRDSNSPT